MSSLFIADAHLTGRQDPNQSKLVEFLQALSRGTPEPESIFILGDLFEFWIGENLVALYEYGPVIEAFRKLSTRGWRINYIEGNHDFFLDSLRTQVANLRIYPNPAEIHLDEKKFFLAHGDTLTPSDLGCRLLRFILHNRLILFLANNLPPGLVWKIAFRLAGLSRQHHYLPEENPLRPVFIDFARGKIREGFDFIILAHSHQAEILALTDKNRSGFYANPGDWMGSRSYLRWASGQLELRSFQK
ncbi:MAG: UDP-2,3-diacylglucosamine diphosphatase [Proteobacteria bacterium]|nr:UDP-2,3-diacylglucosamine diphosphatase [Pseudomonadota bacterium]